MLIVASLSVVLTANMKVVFAIVAIAGLVTFSGAERSIHPLLSLAGSSSRGVVEPVDRCGGTGTPIELRVSECEGSPPCNFRPGNTYDVEIDFIPYEGSNGISLKLSAVLEGIDLVLLNAPIPNSPVSPGVTYTVRYGLPVDNLLAGRYIMLKLEIYHTNHGRGEICVQALGYVVPVPEQKN